MDLNDPLLWVVVAAAVVALVAIISLMVKRRRRQERTDRLRQRFGPEYDRTVRRVGSRASAEQQLEDRLARRDRLQLRPLDDDQRRAFLSRWEDLQASFVDGPASALRGADVLLDDVARARGYPDASGDQRLDDVAFDHSDEVHEYRQAPRDGGDDAEEARRAMLASRALFEKLLGPEPRDAGARGADTPEPPFERVLGDEGAGAGRDHDAEAARGAGDTDPAVRPAGQQPPVDAPIEQPQRHVSPADDPVARSERHVRPADEPGSGGEPPSPVEDPRPGADQHRVPPPPPPEETR